MPLPQDDRTAWPPRVYDPVIPVLEKWSAWYSGDPAQLAAAYGGQAVSSSPWAGSRPRGLFGYTGRGTAAMTGRVRRFFWGAARAEGDQESRLHIPVAGDIAQMSADLLYSEVPDLSVEDEGGPGAGSPTLDRLNEYVEDGLWTRIREGAEIQAALGGVYLRAVWDVDLSERPWLQAMAPDTAVPEWTYDRLSAVTFWRVVHRDSSGTKVIRHLERHESGAILHGLYEGTPRELGSRIPLDAMGESDPEMLAISQAVGGPDREAISTGIDMLTAEYVPNVRPNRIWRQIPEAANLGRSDFSGIEGPMDALDETWTSWMRDIRLGKSKILLDQSALMSAGEGQGATFNIDKELMVGLNFSALDKDPITPIQFAIRVEEHERTTQGLLEQIVRGAGYSMQTFSGETEGGAQTATEVTAKEKRTLTTRDRKIGYWTLALRRSLQMLLALDAEIFGGSYDIEKAPAIEFPDAVSESPGEVATTIQTLEAAKAISVRTKVQMLHPDWDDDQIEEEIEEIEGASKLAQEAEALTKLGQATTLGAVSPDQAQQMTGARAARRDEIAAARQVRRETAAGPRA